MKPVEPGQRCRSSHTDYHGEVVTAELIEEGGRYVSPHGGQIRRARCDFWICWYPGVVGPYRVIIQPEHLEVIQ